MPFLYGTTNEIKNLESEILIKKAEERLKAKSSFSWKLFIQIFSGIASSLLYLIPGIGSLTKLALDVGINLIVDTAFSVVEKQSSSEILTNFALDLLPAAGYFSRYFKNVTKSKILFFAKQSKIVEFEKGVNKLLRNEALHPNTPLYKKFGLTSEELVKKVKKTYNLLDSLKNLNSQIGQKIINSQKIVNSFNKKLSDINNLYRAVIEPRYLVQKAVQNFLEKSGVNKKLNNFIQYTKKYFLDFVTSKIPKNIRAKYLPKFLETIKELKKQKSVLLPLKHTSKDPWIIGVKIQNSGVPNYFHLTWYFNPKTKKPKIISFYKPYHFILNLLKSPSAGNWYIQNISWGWNFNKIFGGHIFTNPFFSSKWVLFSKWPLVNQYLSTIARTYRTIKNFSNTNSNSFLENWKNTLTNKFWLNIIQSTYLSMNLPGINVAKKYYAYSSSGNFKFLSNYVSKNKARKYISNFQKYILIKNTKNYKKW